MRQEPPSILPYMNGPIIHQKPNLPYIEEIPGWIKNGTITFHGRAETGQKGFSINLSTQPCIEPLPDTALHIDVRLQNKIVVFNYYKNGKWGTEERIHDKLLLRQDLSFELMIMITKSEFMIFFHDVYLLSFHHRMDYNTAKYLIIKGFAQIQQIRIDGTTLVPPDTFKSAFPPIFNPKTPFISKILGGLNCQRIITISGYPSKFNPRRFTVNFNTERDIAFHFDVRFRNDHSVVRNSYITKCWGEEETYKPFFPFQPGIGFDLMFTIERYCYKVAVNSQHYITFQHRIKDIETVNQLQITGDVHLIMMQFH
ncbi:galectin-4 [Octopus bimaculoides]|uniref:Galectin n=1 Tax=Octopus bimaculoides TaxID=37653 RepID=A0A0L8HLW0_OCTBM|nr:galectin-4 [Octopus bimaculoides]|eukprot:XP_014771267.1 PREDICTED: galectin-4-like [Octopus bimaculoides]